MRDQPNNIYLRTVNEADEALLLHWANDPETRKWSFNSNIIKQSEHKNWFSTRLLNINVRMWIFEHNDEPSGLVRLEKSNGSVTLNYLIAPEKRRRGLASIMLKLAINELKNHWSKINLLAYTLPENTASQKSLEKAGFYSDISCSKKICYVYNCEN